MVVTYCIKLFRTGADRHNGILMSRLILVAETIMKMKITHIRVTNLAYFLTDTQNKEKYLLNDLYEKFRNKVSFKQMLTVKKQSLPRPSKSVTGQIYSSEFLNSIKL